MSVLLVIDDDDDLFSLLDEYLREEGFSCLHANTGDKGLRAAASKDVVLVILDVMLPGMSGFEVLRQIRGDERTRGLPVIMLTARDEEIDRVLGLEIGADDYLGKPFSPRELVARIRALLRRVPSGPAEAGGESAFAVGDLSVNRASLHVTVGGARQEMTVPEIRLLCLLVETPGEVVSRDRLYADVFGHPAWHGDRSLDMLVSRLRKKLGPRQDGGERIRAARGEGYVYLVGETHDAP